MAPDITIVGQGICGSLLSWALMQRGLTVRVYDTGSHLSATAAASGIINPITGKRYVKSWRIDDLIPVAERTYAAMGQALSIQVYTPMPIYKLLGSVREQNDWSARTTDYAYQQYLSDTILHTLNKDWLLNDFGAFAIQGGGIVHTPSFLARYRDYLRDKEALCEESLTHEQALGLKGRVIFCDGYRSAREGLFTSLPWQIVKGEYLLIRMKDFYDDRIVGGDTTISPAGQPGLWYAGATYQWHYETTAPTQQYREEVIESLHQMLRIPFEVVHHGTGVRPSTRYRRPFIGFHPQHAHIGIFNGMGTKGMSLAPYWAERFASHIVTGEELPAEVALPGSLPVL
ncbi:MAG: FAD-binding oxidoreductase [Bacteroidetes bacterium]|nr:FAD-binding oxidoreductase [Bacteroidota bacterium]